jgi:glycosyltransferase involved in cell wall biosynthesis
MRWVTYFPRLQSVHLTKDVGLLPFYISKSGHRATLLGHGDESLQVPEEVEELEIEKLPSRGNFFFLDRAFMNWIGRHAKEVNVLHLFHLSRDSIFYGMYFKKLNPEGKLYLKMDAYNEHLGSRKSYSKNWMKERVYKGVERRFFKSLDAISIENTAGLNLMHAVLPELREKTFYLPNGVNDIYLKNLENEVSVKENIVLSVGRLGSDVKNYELFLEAVPHLIDLDWKFFIVGPISPQFQSKIDQLFEKYPPCKELIEFKGEISDRRLLYDLYARAKVFFLPSRRESFGIAYIEALYFGCALVGHQSLYAYDDISKSGAFGSYFEDNDAESFARAIRSAIYLSTKENFVENARQHCQHNFTWSRLTNHLLTRLKDD